jgi:chaperonin cofactor prefoldin
MATPQEIQVLLDKLQKAYDKLRKDNPFSKWDANVIANSAESVEQLEVALDGVNARVEALNSSFSDLQSQLQASLDELKKGPDATSRLKSGFQGVLNEVKKLTYEEEGINKLSIKELETLRIKATQKARDGLAAAKELTNGINLQRMANGMVDKQTISYQNLSEAQKFAIAQIEKEDETLQGINDKIDVRIAKENRVNELMGIGGAAIGGVQSGLDKLGFGALGKSLGLDEVNKKMEGTASRIEKLGDRVSSQKGKFMVLQSGIKEAGTQLKKSLTDPVVITTFLITEMVFALKGADKATGELAKSFGTSYKEASNIRGELNTISNLSGNVNMTTEKLGKSLMALNKEFGTATMMSGELLTDFTNLTNVAGYSAEAAAGLARITVATGTDLSDNTAEILGTTAAYNGANKLALNGKEIAEEVAKTSAATTLTLGMQPGAITKAVLASKALGASMAQVEQIASSLLNFESSIEDEMSAELLLGKNLNLEKARTAALNGDIATVAAEIAKQTGTAADFEKMNVIQQEALAKAVGMTREGLASSLMEREALVRLGKEDGNIQEEYNALKAKGLSDDAIANQLGSKKLADQLKSQSVQEKFTASMEKLREIFVSIADPVLAILSPLMDIVTTVLPLINLALIPITLTFRGISESVKGFTDLIHGDLKDGLGGVFQVVSSIGVAWGGIVLASKLLGKETLKNISLQTIFGNLLKKDFWKSVGASIAKMWGSIVGFLGPFGIPVAIAAGAGLLGLATGAFSKGDDVRSGGYGQRTFFDGKDTIALNDQDQFVAGTDLMGTKKREKSNSESPISSASPSIDITPLIDRMSAVEGVLVQILNKEFNVYLDSTKIGTGFAVSTVSIQ